MKINARIGLSLLILLGVILLGYLIKDLNVSGEDNSYDKEKQIIKELNVKDFGAKGDGTTNDVIAFNNAIKEANKSNNQIIFVPSGTYNLPDKLDPITEKGVIIKGEARQTSILKLGNEVTLTFGTLKPRKEWQDHNGIENLTFKYEEPSDSSIAILAQNTGQLTIKNIDLYNVGTFLKNGNIEKGIYAPAHSTRLLNIYGAGYNTDEPLIDFVGGYGFYLTDIVVFNNGVNTPQHGQEMDTRTGRDFIRATNKSIDTIKLSNVMAERFDKIFNINVKKGEVIQNIWIDNSTFDYTATNNIDVNVENGSFVGLYISNSWFSSWEENNVEFTGEGMIENIQISSSQFPMSGKSAVRIENGKNIIISGNLISGIGQATDDKTALFIGENSDVININNNIFTGNTKHTGITWGYDPKLYISNKVLNQIVNNNLTIKQE